MLPAHYTRTPPIDRAETGRGCAGALVTPALPSATFDDTNRPREEPSLVPAQQEAFCPRVETISAVAEER